MLVYVRGTRPPDRSHALRRIAEAARFLTHRARALPDALAAGPFIGMMNRKTARVPPSGALRAVLCLADAGHQPAHPLPVPPGAISVTCPSEASTVTCHMATPSCTRMICHLSPDRLQTS